VKRKVPFLMSAVLALILFCPIPYIESTCEPCDIDKTQDPEGLIMCDDVCRGPKHVVLSSPLILNLIDLVKSTLKHKISLESVTIDKGAGLYGYVLEITENQMNLKVGDNLGTKPNSKKAFEQFSASLEKNGFWQLKERYVPDSMIMDAMGISIEVKLADGIVKEVYCYADCPQEMLNIAEDAEKLWGEKIIYNAM